MGFFSGIINFIKDIVSKVLGAIAKFLNGIFGSPIVAALVLLVAAWFIVGPFAFAQFAANPLLYISTTAGFIMTSLVANLLIQVVSVICPELGRVLGYVMGIISFVMMGLNVYSLWQNGTWAGASVAYQIFGTVMPDTMLADAFWIYSELQLVTTLAFITSLAAGVDANGEFKSEFARGYVDGFFKVPTVIGDVTDSVVESAADALWSAFWPIAIGVGAIWWLSRDKGTTINVQDAQKGEAYGAT